MILLMQLFDCLKHSGIMQKRIKQFYYDKTMVNFCKGCYVNMFLLKKL